MGFWADEILLSCRILADDPYRSLIETDLRSSWFDRSEFSIASIGFGSDPDIIRVSQRLAAQRGIT